MTVPSSPPPSSSREWQLIEKMLLSMQDEQRKARRWGVFFKLLTFAYLLLVLLLFLPMRLGLSGATAPVAEPHVGLVDLNGMIAPDTDASADMVVRSLRAAFEAEHSRAVLLRINSPGGSPVQSGVIYREIQRLRDLHPDKTVYAVITDMGASGAYYVAAAADEIYVDPASLVGSIGVIMSSFGFTEAMEKLGVERRTQTAGDHKALLDPFAPEREEDRRHLQGMLDQIHRQFIDAVLAGRGERLDPSQHPDLFTGLVWTGEQAVAMGLADGFGSPGSVAREQAGLEKVVNYTVQRSPLQQLMKGFGVSVGHGLGQWLSGSAPASIR